MIKDLINKIVNAEIKITKTSVEVDFSKDPLNQDDLDNLEIFTNPSSWAAKLGVKLGEKQKKENK